MKPGNELTLMPRLKTSALRDGHLPHVESFYHLTSDGVSGKSCCGTACFVARHLNPQQWEEAVADNTRVYCLGKCYIGPCSSSEETRPRIESRCRTPVVLERLASGGAHHLENYVDAEGYRAIEKALEQTRDQVIRAVEISQLRGRGGAAFPAGKKWRLAAQQSSPEKFIVANADEGDPGSYIDRFILEEDPHCLIEGMALAGYAVGATKGWVYIRNEYPHAQKVFQSAVQAAREAGFLGGDNGGFAFDIEIATGLGSYVCGEETALINSIEGQRPVAMARPPYATDHGLFGKPTVMNNVETLASIPWIVRHGGEAYAALGFSKSRGTKVVSLNSLFHRPGLYEIEFGVPVREIVEELGGGLKTGELKGVMIGGPLAGVIPPRLLDTRFGFEELRAIGASIGHAGIVAFDERTTIPELIHYIFSFAAFESCGKCTSCRLGTRKIEKLFEKILEEGVAAQKKAEWAEMVAALKLTSLCGLGTGVADFAESISRHYEKELSAWLK